ncbi:TPA_exp: Uncharacterized protein A8136_6420 [Trichophyton benhamiae CBS 112371]|uniref:UBL3-like ubiquitin domain-containing protein n=1 Tax=Arthroderma benhamiae (strain ATCC MYA-4681 / CBS 112371) TaxID=663331 RepID=D4B5Z7_ARTBC|nr:uncharacterized protein ARB_03904 [Trichophyton benhamiae CBS 112371]EFE29333.1 conserved hypothetical protein [Trichophyton benhamiae CBS 112371]DAA72617.1 TPA_exp: Uncharacterized protein A8136_6420 [Trichophyton benhamiae CBS 112371]
MAFVNEAEKGTRADSAPNESSVPTTRPEADDFAHGTSIQTSAVALQENMRMPEGEQEQAVQGTVVDAKEAEPQPSPQQLSLGQEQQIRQPDSKPEAGGPTSISPEEAGQSSIGASVEGQPSVSLSQSTSSNDGPTLLLNILLTSGGKHPFKLDGKYLRKREVNVADNDPFSMSVYTLKELIWREWRSDWEPRPSSPAAIRLISFGKLLDDKSPLSECRFNREGPNVVHMTIKPQEIVDEEDAKAAKSTQSREHEEGERSPGCRCAIL